MTTALLEPGTPLAWARANSLVDEGAGGAGAGVDGGEVAGGVITSGATVVVTPMVVLLHAAVDEVVGSTIVMGVLVDRNPHPPSTIAATAAATIALHCIDRTLPVTRWQSGCSAGAHGFRRATGGGYPLPRCARSSIG